MMPWIWCAAAGWLRLSSRLPLLWQRTAA